MLLSVLFQIYIFDADYFLNRIMRKYFLEQILRAGKKSIYLF